MNEELAALVDASPNFQDLRDRIRELASSLQVAEVSDSDLRAHAASTGDEDRLHRLESSRRGTA